MTTHADVWELVQTTYFDNVDRGDMGAAVQAFTHDVDWSYLPAWSHDRRRGHAVSPDEFRDRDALHEFLVGLADKVSKYGVTHTAKELVFDEETNNGAILAQVDRADGGWTSFMAWITVHNGLISRYTMRPIASS